MFDFEKLEVYIRAKKFNHTFFTFIHSCSNLDKVTRDQLRRASFSVMLNIAEGSSRFSRPDKKNFYTIARGSVFECVAILDFLNEESLVDKAFYTQQYQASEELSKMLMGLIKGLN